MPVSIGGSGFITGLDQGIAGVGIITAATFSGDLTGNVNSSGVSTVTSLNSTNATITNINSSGISTVSQLNVGTGGNVITTTAGGLVGIGTTNPNYPLSVTGQIGIEDNSESDLYFDVDYGNGTTSSAAIFSYPGRFGIYQTRNGRNNNYIFYYNQDATTPSSDYLRFDVGDSEKFRVTGSGYIGIGTNNPQEKLEIEEGNIRLSTDASGGVPKYAINWTGGGAGQVAVFSANTSTGEVRMGADNSSGTYFTTLYSNGAERLRIDSSGRVTMPYQPMFQAYGVSGGTYASGSYYIFPSTYVNVGGHYNTSNGIFTAPIAGTYFFTWSHIGGNNGTVYRFYIRKNNSQIGDWHLRLDTSATGSEYGHNGNRNIIISASANDTFRIYFQSDDGSNSYPGTNSTTDTYPTFGGYLIG